MNVMRIFGSAVRCPKRDHDCYHPGEQSSPLRDMLYCSAVLFAGEAGSILDSKLAGARLPEWMNTHAGTMPEPETVRQHSLDVDLMTRIHIIGVLNITRIV